MVLIAVVVVSFNEMETMRVILVWGFFDASGQTAIESNGKYLVKRTIMVRRTREQALPRFRHENILHGRFCL